MNASSGPTATPCFMSAAATGKTTYGPPGINSPISQPISTPLTPDCSPIQATSVSRGSSTLKNPAKQKPNSSGSQTSCSRPAADWNPLSGSAGLLRKATTISPSVRPAMMRTPVFMVRFLDAVPRRGAEGPEGDVGGEPETDEAPGPYGVTLPGFRGSVMGAAPPTYPCRGVVGSADGARRRLVRRSR